MLLVVSLCKDGELRHRTFETLNALYETVECGGYEDVEEAKVFEINGGTLHEVHGDVFRKFPCSKLHNDPGYVTPSYRDTESH